MLKFCCCAACAIVATAAHVSAGAVSIEPVRDNTLMESLPDQTGEISNGAGDYIFAGTTGASFRRRAVIAFDIAAAIPAGAQIESASLTLNMTRTLTGDSDVAIHALTADWGEGTSDATGNEGAGAASTPGDATWLHTFYDDQFWTTPGGDFDPDPSAITTVGSLGLYTWSSPAMAADVQSWLDAPGQNNGWILIGNEAFSTTAKRFDSRDNDASANPPTLMIEFSMPCPADLDASGDVGSGDLAILLGSWGPGAGPADLTGDDSVGSDDLAALLGSWGPCP